MPARKYISIINKGGDSIYIKDAEAREAIAQIETLEYKDVYIGVGAAYTDVMIAADHHDSLSKGVLVPLTASSNYIWVILPNTYSPIVQMGGLNVPMTAQSDVTVGDVTHKVLRSTNQYTGSFPVSLA
jgi:hypothetical protein